MGIRMTQWVGLRDDAEAWLNQNCVNIKKFDTCPHCGGEINVRYIASCRKYANAYGMNDEELSLYIYDIKDGTTLKEVEQASPWSSGPVIFTCLEDENGNRRFQWTDEEIEENL